MKIVFIAMKGIDRIGGVETYTLELGKRLANIGHQVVVYTIKDNKYSRPFYNQGIQFIPLPTIRHRFFEKMVLVFLASFHQFTLKNVDVVHYQAIGPSLFCFIPRLGGRYTVFQSHGHEWAHAWNRVAEWFFLFSERLSFWFANDVTAVSKSLQKYYRNKYKYDVTYIPTGINPPQQNVSDVLNQNGLKSGQYILYVGRLAREKRIHNLIEAFQQIDQSGIKLAIVGAERAGDSYINELHKLAANNPHIVFTGAVYGDALLNLYKHAFVYVLPSQSEGLPITLLEAMSAGCFCIASDIDANVEALDGKGALFPVGNIAALATCLRETIANPESTRSAGNVLREHVLKHYTWALVTDKFINFYQKAAEELPADHEKGIVFPMMQNSNTAMAQPVERKQPMLELAASTPLPVSDKAGTMDYYSTSRETVLFKHYWKTLRHHAWPILAFTLISILFLLSLALLTNPTFTARSSIKIDTTSPRLLDYDVDTLRPPSYVDEVVFYNTQYKMLRSRDLAEQVINKLGIRDELLNERKFKPAVYWVVDPLKDMAGALRDLLPNDNMQGTETPLITAEEIFLKNLSIIPVKSSRIIDINYTAQAPETARNIVQTLTDTFILNKYSERKETAETARKFLNEQLDQAGQKLQQSEAALIEYARENKIVDTNSDEPVIAKNIEELSKAYMTAKENRIRAQSQYNKKASLSGILNASDDTVIQEHKKELSKLEGAYLANLELFKPNYPAMLSLQSQIDTRKRLIAQETSRIRNNTEDNLKASFEAAQAEEQKINTEIQKLENDLLQFRDKNIGYTNLKRDVDTSRSLYEGILQRLKEIGVVETAQTDNISIVDKAILPPRKDGPVYLKYLALGALAGLFLGSLFVLLRETMKPAVRSLEDLHDISGGKYQVLTSLPYSRSLASRDLTTAFGNSRSSGWLDAMRYLKVSLMLGNSGKLPKVLHVTSPLPAEGKSTTAISLATLLANSGKEVLLIDADLRKPTVHKRLNLPDDYGLTNHLTTAEEGRLIHKVRNGRRLFVICAGPAIMDPVEALSSDRMQDLLNRSRATFDHIIIDAPPVLGMADSLVLSNRADGTILIAATDRSTKQDVRLAIGQLEKSHANILGIVQSMAPVAEKYSSNYSDGRAMISPA